MGCYREESEAEKQAVREAASKVLRDLQKDANNLTIYLCAASKMLTKAQAAKMPKGYSEWKTNHDELDRRRIAKEKSDAKKKIIAKEKARIKAIADNKKALEKAKRNLKKLMNTKA